MIKNRSRAFLFALRTCFAASIIFFALGNPAHTKEVGPALRIKVIFDNVGFNQQLESAWGFSCIIEGLPQVLLFDTGSDGSILLSNMKKLGIDSKDVDAVFLSHLHGDHTGGLQLFLQQNPNVTVFVPASFPESFKESVRAPGLVFKSLNKPEKLFNKVYTSGEMGSWVKEQSLVISTSKGLVIITGCAHPGIVQIVKNIKNRLPKEVYVVMGGFHLAGEPLTELYRVGRELKELGVQKVAPSHCSGEAARKIFRDLWGQNFIESGVGAIINLQP